MTTDVNGDVLDGEIADLAIQSDATTAPLTKRGWIAQGFARAAIRVSDGARMNAETATFHAHTGAPEKPIAVELDEARSYLYTLTKYVLYREDVINPAFATNRIPFDFFTAANLTPALHAGEILVDVRVIPFVGGTPSDSRILVLTSERLIVMRSDTSGLGVIGQCLDVYNAVPNGGFLTQNSSDFLDDWTFNEHRIKSFASVKVATDAAGLTVAYVQANPSVFNFRSAQRAILMLCNLDAANGFLAPTFDVDPSPTAREFAYWSPFTMPPPVPALTADEVQALAIHDLTVRFNGGQTEVLAACGKTQQLKRLTAAFSATGVVASSTVTLDAQQNMRQVTLDPIVPNRLYVRGTTNFFVVDLSGTPTTLASITERANEVDRGDATIVRTTGALGVRRTHWALCGLFEDYNLQAIEVTATVPVQTFGDGYIERCDGGVALDADNSYVCTGTGVRHYRKVAGVWEQAVYKPSSSDALSAFGGRFPEQIEIVTVGGAHQILGASNGGIDCGLFAWPLDAAKDPVNGTYYAFPTSVFSAWTTGDVAYVNDVTTFTAGSYTYAALCPTRLGPPHGVNPWEVAVVLYRWDPAASKWVLKASAYRTGPSLTFANTITVANLASSADRVAFVACDTGVMSFSLKSLTSGTPVVKFESEDYGGVLHGVAATPQHLIAAYTHLTNNPNPRYVAYTWDQFTGAINLGLTQVFPVSQLGAPIGESWKLRYDPLTSSTGDLYDANQIGAIRLSYTASPLSITHVATWLHQGSNLVQDCRPYSFGGVKKLMVTKDDQGFAWVIP